MKNAVGGLKENELVRSSYKFHGGFIQYTNDSISMPQDKWRELIETMAVEAEMNVIIIQRLVSSRTHTPDESSPHNHSDRVRVEIEDEFYYPDYSIPNNPKDKGPTETVLASADEKGIDVYVGLWEDANFNWENINHKYLKNVEDKYLSLAKALWPLYRRHASFKGWYLPLEMWNHPDSIEKIQLLNSFLRGTIARLRTDVLDEKKSDSSFANEKECLANKKIVVSPYFVPKWRVEQDWLSPAEQVKEIYYRTLYNTGVNILMLQDGTGARTIRGDAQDKEKWRDLSAYLHEVTKYTEAFRGAAQQLSSEENLEELKFWGNLESFEPEWIPTDIQRLEKQFQAQPLGVSNFVTFDFFHYLNPIVPNGYGNGTQEQRKTLYCDYLERFLNKVCRS